MADTKTSAETAAGTLDGTELVRIVQTGSSVRTTTQDIADLGTGGAFSGALVKKAANQTTANYSTVTAVAWDENNANGAYLTDAAIHSTSVNNTRLTTLAGWEKVRVKAVIDGQDATNGSRMYLTIYKNGSADYPGMDFDEDAVLSGQIHVSAQTGVINIVGGTDYFEAMFLCADTSVTLFAARCSFSIEKVA